MQEKLKPCPFCGGQPNEEIQTYNFCGGITARITCYCGAAMYGESYYKELEAKKDVVDRWNRRVK